MARLIDALREEAAHIALPASGEPLSEYHATGAHAGTGIMIWSSNAREGGPVNGSVWVVYPDRDVVTLHYFSARTNDGLFDRPGTRDEDDFRAEFDLRTPSGRDPIEHFGALFTEAVQKEKFGP